MRATKRAFPYIRLAYDDVEVVPAAGWALVESERETLVVDGDGIESWDTNRALAFRRTFRFPADTLKRLCIDEDHGRVGLIVTVATARGTSRHELFRSEVPLAQGNPLEVIVRPDSALLAFDLKLEAVLYLISAGDPVSPISARYFGARLWEDECVFALEGGRGRLPMESLSFRDVFKAEGFEHALFHVELAAEAELDVEQGVRIYLNSDFPLFVAAIGQREKAASTLLWTGVIRRLIEGSFAAGFSAAGEPGSMGSNISRWLAQAFPGMRSETVARLMVEEPARFEATLDSWMGIGGMLFEAERS